MNTARNVWLINPWMDALLFIGAPLAILPLFHAASLLIPLAVFQFAVLGLSATGHHLPGFIRAYTDPAVFRRFRARLVVVPALIVALAAVASWYRLSLIFFLLIVWGTWHGLMQVHGFLRLYDAKAGIRSALVARLDFWMCLTWFVQVVLWSSGKKMSLLGTFYLAGGPLLPAPTMRIAETAWLALTVAITAAWLVTTALEARRGRFNPRKVAALAVAIGFWAYCLIGIGNLIVGLLLWEIFHDLQYNAFVWTYNRSRVSRNLSGSRFERFLFRGGWSRVAIYAACIAAYGCLGFFGQDLINAYRNEETYGSVWRQIGNVFAASALIHFYLDGFIWKMRDAKVMEDLGVRTDAATPGSAVPEVRHWAFVAILFAGALALGASERLHWTRSQQDTMYANLTSLVPSNGYAHFMRASELKSAGRFDEALAHYRRAIALDPEYAFVHALAADLAVRVGDTAAAIASYEAARTQDPSDPLVLGNLADLYLAAGRLEAARAAFEGVTALEPDNAAAHYGLAVALLGLRRGLDAKPHLERTLALDSLQPAALNYLGMVEHATGNRERARVLYERALLLAPDYASARRNLKVLTER